MILGSGDNKLLEEKFKASDKTEKPILEIRDLKVSFQTYAGIVKALDGVELRISRGETVGLVGETGSGKTMLQDAC